jgi:predicted metal-dependent hydrolase
VIAHERARFGHTTSVCSPVMEVEVIRSQRRRRSGQARVVDGVIHVSIPAGLPAAEEERLVSHLVDKIERKRAAEPIDLAARCELLAARYGLPQPTSVRWVDNQVFRWGSCTPVERSIRISTRVAAFPTWVLDAVLVHELAHLVEHGHGAEFWSLANRYPKMERARGFLIAKGLGDEAEEPPPLPRESVPGPVARPRPLPRRPQQHTLW